MKPTTSMIPFKASYIFFAICLLQSTCIAPKAASSEEETSKIETATVQDQNPLAQVAEDILDETVAPKKQSAEEEKPHFIVNTRMRNTDWSKIEPWISSVTALRLPGGSVSQYTWGEEGHIPKWLLEDAKKQKQQTIITNEDILIVKNIQDTHGIELYWCININDAIDNQLALIKRFENQGVVFSHLEIGNETYLPKFRKGKKAGLGFVREIGIDDYAKLAVDWAKALKNHPAKKLLVGASRTMDGSGGDAYRAQWNDKIAALIETYPAHFDGVAVHVYGGKGGSSSNEGEEETMASMDLSFMDIFSLPIHITESGHKDVDWSDEGIALYKSFYKGLHAYLEARGDGSRCGAHVLYNPRREPNHPYPLYDPNGITPLGKAAKDFPF